MSTTDDYLQRHQEWLPVAHAGERQRIRDWLAPSTGRSAEEVAKLCDESLDAARYTALREQLARHL